MSNDILGPADSANAVTVRPAEGRTFGLQDSWFKDCSDPDIDDGTEVRSDFINGMVAALRALWRMNGNRADGVTPITPEVGTDDFGLVKALQQLVQRGQVIYAADAGAVNALAVTLAPALIEYKPGLTIRVKVANTTTGATSINVNGLGAKPVIHPDGAPIGKRELVAGMIAELVYDGASFQVVGAPINQLTANADYYVNAGTGNDANDGLTSGTAFATLQKAQNTINLFNLNGYSVTVHVANGSYGPVTCGAINGSGSINYVGNVASPSSVVVTGTVGPAFIVSGNSYTFDGFKVVSVGNQPGLLGCGFAIAGGASLKAIEFGAALDAQIWIPSGRLSIAGPITISGSSPAFIYAVAGGAVQTAVAPEPSITFSAAVTYSTGFIVTRTNAVTTAHFAAINNPGNVTGARYVATGNGVIDTNGSGVNYYPGTVAGSTATGGQYL